MDIAPLLTGSRWQLLEALAERPLSPGELAQATKTTTANVSAQLRLLEAVGVVSKIRLGTAEPGKPRILYSLPANQAYIISLSQGRVRKELSQTSAFDAMLIDLLVANISQSTAAVQFLCTHKDEFSEKKFALTLGPSEVKVAIEGKGRKIQHEQNGTKMEITFVSALKQVPNTYEDKQ